MKKLNHPPRWAERLLSWYCRPEMLEDLQGDLNEYFQRNVASRGLFRARLIYALDVLKFFRSYTVRKPDILHLLSPWFMIRSYVTTARRSIGKSKLFSGINIVGLAISMSVGLLAIAFVSDLTTYDHFHEKGDRIYTVWNTYRPVNDRPMDLHSTSIRAGKRIAEEVEGIEKVLLMRNNFNGMAFNGKEYLPVNGHWASETFFDVFTFPLLQGNPATALAKPYSLVVTEETARRLFGTTDALGKTVSFDSLSYEITGVMRDIPKLSHIRFEVLASMSTADILLSRDDPNYFTWGSIWNNYIYLLAGKDADMTRIQRSLDKISAAEKRPGDRVTISLFVKPLRDIVLGKRLSNPIGMSLPAIVPWICAGLTIVTVLSACFNYTNLSIARAYRRSREVGIRKLIGARRSHVMGQFLAESIIVSLLALVASMPLFLFLRSQFLALDPHIGRLVSLSLSPRLVALFIAASVIVGIIAGLLPAIYFARITALRVLKTMTTVRVFRHVTLRKALIVAQYATSIIFITTVIIGYRQYKGFISFDLGFQTENILNVRLQGKGGDELVRQLEQLPAVKGVSRSLIVTSLGSIGGLMMKYQDEQDSAMVMLNVIDEHYVPLHGHKLVAGRNLHRLSHGQEEHEVLVNEQVLKRFNIGGGNPARALGETVLVDKKRLTVVGVLKDFHYETVEEDIPPVMFRYGIDNNWSYVNVKVSSGDLPGTMDAIAAAWKKFDPVHPLHATFYDDQIQEAYGQFSVMLKVIGVIAFLAVCIATMGLFGMVVFATETRLREMSIRKVLGATDRTLIFLLSSGFITLLFIAVAIALPATWLFFDKVVLTQFAYHSPIGALELLTGPVIVILLACFMIALQTADVARSNPAEVLKTE